MQKIQTYNFNNILQPKNGCNKRVIDFYSKGLSQHSGALSNISFSKCLEINLIAY